MSKILSIIGRKKELLERKIGKKKQNRLIPSQFSQIQSYFRNNRTGSVLCENYSGIIGYN